MRQFHRSLYLLFFFTWPVAVSYADIQLDGPILVASTPDVTLRMQGPNIQSLVNHVSGETHIGRPGPGWFDLIMQEPTETLLQPGPWRIEFDSATGRQVGRMTASDAFRQITLTVATDSVSGEIGIRVAGSSTRPGVRGALWAMQGFKPDGGRFLIPGQAGVYFDADSPTPRTGLEYPTHWEAQFAIYETAVGGLLVYARDPKPYFKRIHLSRELGTLDLALETFALAPWSQATEIPVLEWRIKAFRGNWRSAVDYYRAWSSQVLPVPPRPQPDWVSRIQVVTRVLSPVVEHLDEIAARLDPSKTLLYLINWRKDPYDVNYPDYTPHEQTAAFVERAHKLGFKVMLHANALGVAVYHPSYPSVSRFQIRNPDSGELVFWPFGLWPGGVPPPEYLPSYAFISPAASEYRRLWIEALKPSLDAIKPDVLHVDAGGVMLNDSNGLIEGKTTIEGMIELNRELLQAYPQLVLSFESMTEFLSPLFGFAQRWNSDLPPHPIGAYLFRDQMNMYGFLDQENPDDAGFIDYLRRYEYQGILSTIEINSLLREQETDHPISEMFFKVQRLWQQYNFRPDWDGDWEGAQFRLKSEDGQTSAVFEDLGDIVRLKVGDEILYERARNTNSLETGSFIRGWLAFGGSSIYGLDPEREYWLESGVPRSDQVVHLSNLSSETKLGLGARATKDYGYFELERIPQSTFDFVRGFSAARIGVIYYGREYPLTINGSVQLSQTMVGGMLKSPVLFMNPPAGYPGAVIFAEYQVPVPDAPSYLNFSAGISDFATASDGALFVVRIGGTEVFRQIVNRGKLVPMQINLTPWAGRSVDIRFIVHPGVRLDPRQDFAVWSDLSISLEDRETLVEFDVALPAGSESGSIGGTAMWTGQENAGHSRARSTWPAKFVVFANPPPPVEVEMSLLDLPFDVWRATYKGMPALGRAEVSGSIRPIISGNVEKKRALAAYPPIKGKTSITWAVQLSQSAKSLAFSVALADPPAPLTAVDYSGATVSIRFNGETVFKRTLRLSGWNPEFVDIARWAGQNAVIELETDSDSNAIYDWIYWADLKIQ